jgi:photosystem II stability/assembly factor-like uncharacterized protein
MRRSLVSALVVTLLGLGASDPARAGINLWTTGGPGSGSVFVMALAIDPATPGTLYAGTRSGGVFKSTDAGTSWAPMNAGLTNLDVRALAIDPKTPSTLYAGTERGGVFKSTDGGVSWAPASAGLTDLLITALAIDPETPSTLYAGTFFAGVFKSTDGGTSWAHMSTGLDGFALGALAIAPTNPSTLYAGLGLGGLFKSTNGGASWVPMNTGLPDPPGILALAIDPTTPSTLYVFAPDVFKSIDGGTSWTSMGFVDTVIVRALAVDFFESDTVYAGTDFGGVLRSQNGGAWTAMNQGLTTLFVFTLAADPTTPGRLYAGTVGSGAFDFQRVCGGDGVSTVIGASGIHVGQGVSIDGQITSAATITIGKAATICGDVSGEVVNLGAAAVIDGNVGANEIDTGRDARITGTVNPITVPLLELCPVEVTPGVEQVTVPKNRATRLQAGDFQSIVSGESAEIRFAGGQYNVSAFRVGKSTRLIFEAPTTISVASRLTIGEGAEIVGTGGMTAADIRLHYAGSADAVLGKKVQGALSLVAPNALIQIREDGVYSGLIWGKTVRIAKGVHVNVSCPAPAGR